MMRKLALAAVAAATLGSSAVLAAEFYVVQEKSSKKCRVVETRPKETTWVQIGPAAFKTRAEAEKQVTVLCKEKR